MGTKKEEELRQMNLDAENELQKECSLKEEVLAKKEEELKRKMESEKQILRKNQELTKKQQELMQHNRHAENELVRERLLKEQGLAKIEKKLRKKEQLQKQLLPK